MYVGKHRDSDSTDLAIYNGTIAVSVGAHLGDSPAIVLVTNAGSMIVNLDEEQRARILAEAQRVFEAQS